jgi:hypothetical protein
MATFRCLVSGQTVTFIHQHDIDSMKGHAGYVRIDEEEKESFEKPLILSQPQPIKKAGRPKKVANV